MVRFLGLCSSVQALSIGEGEVGVEALEEVAPLVVEWGGETSWLLEALVVSSL